MKKVLVFMIMFILLNYFSINMIVMEKNNINEYIILNDSDELNELLDKKDKVILYFFKKDCMACNNFKDILNKFIIEENIKVYAIDINSAGFNYTDLITDYNLTMTPSVLILKTGDELKRIEGVISENKFKDFLENY